MDKSSLPETVASRHPFLTADTVLQNRYRVVRQLGSGGMGAVYEAIDGRLDSTVAIKETFSADERLRRQFEQEARLLAQLHHPNLPRVSDYFTEDGRAFLVMQFIAGDDLAQIISLQPGPFPQNQVIAWADQLLDALIYLHTRDRQIIHRDIKPHNLKLTASGQIALLDFGLAKTHGPDHSTTQSSNSVFGFTRRYSPIEQIQDEGTSPQSDIYALGATLYHLITRIKPPDALARAGALANSQADPLLPANKICAAVGPEISEILNKALSLNAGDRYKDAGEFREALKRVGRESQPVSILERSSDLRGYYAEAKRGGLPKSDPFDSYSILKPQQDAFVIPKPRRTPVAIAVALALLVIVFVALGYNQEGSINPSVRLDRTRPGPARESSAAAALRQNKADASSSQTSEIRNLSSGSAGEVNRKTDAQKRRGQRPASPANARGLRPPPFSIAP